MCTLHPMQCFVGPHGFVYVLRHALRLSETPHFWGLRSPAVWGATFVVFMTPKFELGQDFISILFHM